MFACSIFSILNTVQYIMFYIHLQLALKLSRNFKSQFPSAAPSLLANINPSPTYINFYAVAIGECYRAANLNQDSMGHYGSSRILQGFLELQLVDLPSDRVCTVLGLMPIGIASGMTSINFLDVWKGVILTTTVQGAHSSH